MRKYSHISVRVPEDVLDSFLAKVSEFAASSWRRNHAGEEEAGALVKPMSVRYIIFQSVAPPDAELYFLHNEGKLELINVFTDGNGITHEDHERFSRNLWDAGFRQAASECKLEAEYLPTRIIKPEESLPPPVGAALHRFAISVNRSTGSADLEDQHLWGQYLALLHLHGATFGEVELDDFLERHRFPEEIRMELLHEQEVALTTLRLYDKIRADAPGGRVQ